MSRSNISPAKLAANRANALRSTGPRTEQGKQRSSMNAVTFGAFTEQLVLEEAQADEFAELRRGLVDSYRPQNLAEMQLIEQVVTATWRARRILLMEREMFQQEMSRRGVSGDEVLSKLMSDQRLRRPYNGLTAAEQQCQRTISRAHRELQRLRQLRREQQEESASDTFALTATAHEKKVKNEPKVAASEEASSGYDGDSLAPTLRDAISFAAKSIGRIRSAPMRSNKPPNPLS